MPILPRTLFTPDDDEAISVYELFSWDLPGVKKHRQFGNSAIRIPKVYKTRNK